MKKPLKRIAITGAGGQIAYNLLFRIASGEMLGLDQPIALHLLETPFGFDALKGVVMELEDCCYPLLREIRIGTDPIEIFEDIDYALLVGAKPRSMDMERKDLLADNGKIFIEQGKALDKVASKQVLTLVVGNPCNTNCWIALEHAPSINKRQFFAMTLLDQNRASYQLSRKASVGVERVSHVAIWGNHSSTQVPDFHNAKISGKPAEEMIGDQKWLETDFIHTIQRRGAEIIQARGKSSAASAAHAIIYTMRSLVFPTPKGEIFSCAIHSKGNPYGIAGELIFSFPCISKGEGKVEIVKGFSLTPFLKEKIVITQNELIEEKRVVIEALGL